MGVGRSGQLAGRLVRCMQTLLCCVRCAPFQTCVLAQTLRLHRRRRWRGQLLGRRKQEAAGAGGHVLGVLGAGWLAGWLLPQAFWPQMAALAVIQAESCHSRPSVYRFCKVATPTQPPFHTLLPPPSLHPQIAGYPTSIAALAFNGAATQLAVAASYTFEQVGVQGQRAFAPSGGPAEAGSSWRAGCAYASSHRAATQ